MKDVRIVSPVQNNPLLMEQFDIITLVFFGLAVLSVALGIWACIVFTKPVEMEFGDDGPGHYEEVEYSERPFVEYF